MISYKHRFIFIHIPKNAGTSIRRALRPHLRNGWHKIRDELGRPFGSMPYHYKGQPAHLKAHEYEALLGRARFQDFRKFAVVRNPWDWHVSLFAYMQQTPQHFQHDIVKGFDFKDYVQWRCDEDPTSQLPYLADSSEQKIEASIAHFETLSNDFNAIMGEFSITARLPHRNKSDHKPYREYYDDRTIDMIAALSKDDIAAFGYSF